MLSPLAGATRISRTIGQWMDDAMALSHGYVIGDVRWLQMCCPGVGWAYVVINYVRDLIGP